MCFLVVQEVEERCEEVKDDTRAGGLQKAGLRSTSSEYNKWYQAIIGSMFEWLQKSAV